jgi:Skp family chaperone for outer membrane proteins
MDNTKKLLATLLVSLVCTSPCLAAGGPAQSLPVKIGYFNLALVKASNPESSSSETLRVTAENLLRRDVEEGNKRLQKLQDEKKPQEEIQNAAKQLQTEINAKQRSLIELVQTQQQLANQQVATAVAKVARERNLDLVIDGAGVFAGGDKIVASGEDITDAVIKMLAPNLARPQTTPEKPASK